MSEPVELWRSEHGHFRLLAVWVGDAAVIRDEEESGKLLNAITVGQVTIPALIRFLCPEIDALREVAEAADWLYAHSTVFMAEEPRLRLEAALAKLRTAERKERT